MTNDLQKRNNWFNNYQTAYGLKGQRNLEGRLKFFLDSDFKNATVIDIGCNIGLMTQYACSKGAKSILGIDYDEEAIKIAIENNNNKNVEFKCNDIDNYFFWSSLPNFDVTFLFSIIDTKELINPFGMLSKLCMKTNNILYFEGHRHTGDYTNYMHFLHRYTDFTHIEYLGEINDTIPPTINNDTRPFFRCSRKIYTMNEAAQKITSFIESNKLIKIAIIGKSSCGKTTLKKMIIHEFKKRKSFNILHYYVDQQLEMNFFPKYININTNTNKFVSIMDDISHENLLNIMKKYNFKNPQHLICFDYRALSYIENFDIVFHINSNRTSNDPKYKYNKLSEGLENNKLIKRIYHINNNI